MSSADTVGLGEQVQDMAKMEPRQAQFNLQGTVAQSWIHKISPISCPAVSDGSWNQIGAPKAVTPQLWHVDGILEQNWKK